MQTLVRRRAGGKTKRRTFLPARPRMQILQNHLAILPSCHLNTNQSSGRLSKAFFDMLRQKNENENEDMKQQLTAIYQQFILSFNGDFISTAIIINYKAINLLYSAIMIDFNSFKIAG